MDRMIEQPVFKVGLVLTDGFPLMAYASAMEPLRASNLLANSPLYEVRHLPVTGARSFSSSGAVIGADAFIGEHVDFDLILVIAGSEVANLKSPHLSRWLRLLANRGVLIGGVSGGPLLLARAGIMNGYRMTIHWDHIDSLTSVSHQLIIERSLYILDRDRLTCAGGAAALDMMHALIAKQRGQAFAQRISDWFLHTDIRSGEGPQRSGIAQRYNTNNKYLLRALEAMENHIADPLELGQLAALSGLGERHLSRLFQLHFNSSAVNYYRKMRLEKAQQMLKQSGLSVLEVALATGFASGSHFSRLFKQYYGLSPRQYSTELESARG